MKVKEFKTALRPNRQPILKETGRAYNIDGRKQFNNPETIAEFMLNQIGTKEAAEEYVYVLCLDNRNHLTGLFEASHGSVNSAMFPVREICQKALMLGAVNMIITHNHPGGDPTPSKEDMAATQRIKEAGGIIDVQVLDHIITAGVTGSYYSFCENGQI